MKKQIVWVVNEYDGFDSTPISTELFTTKEVAEQFVKVMEADELFGNQFNYTIREQILWDCIPNKADSVDTYGE